MGVGVRLERFGDSDISLVIHNRLRNRVSTEDEVLLISGKHYVKGATPDMGGYSKLGNGHFFIN